MLHVEDTRHAGSAAVTFAQGHGLDGPWGMVTGDINVCLKREGWGQYAGWNVVMDWMALGDGDR